MKNNQKELRLSLRCSGDKWRIKTGSNPVIGNFSKRQTKVLNPVPFLTCLCITLSYSPRQKCKHQEEFTHSSVCITPLFLQPNHREEVQKCTTFEEARRDWRKKTLTKAFLCLTKHTKV